MSAPTTLMTYVPAQADPERWHRIRYYAAVAAAVLLLVGLAVYGADYYGLSAEQRPFSPKHDLLKPSGRIGIQLGVLGVALFLVIFMYVARKRVRAWSQRGNTRHWLDFHVVVGLTAPVVIAFHSSFKFQGIAGMAFWLMLAVALSGIIGRYLYAQIPRSLTSAQLSLKDLQDLEAAMTGTLAHQTIFTAADLAPLLKMPPVAEVHSMAVYRAFLRLLWIDLARPFRIARLRRHGLGMLETIACLGGLLRTSHAELERVIRAARRKAALSKRIVFLGHTQQVFRLWHVVHKPFSYSFVVLAVLHIAVVILLGFV